MFELTETAENCPVAQETPRPFLADAAAQTEASIARPAWKSRLAKWLLPPLCLYTIAVLVKVTLLMSDLFGIIDTVYRANLAN